MKANISRKLAPYLTLALVLASALAAAKRGGYSGGGGDTAVNPTTYESWFSRSDQTVAVYAEFSPDFTQKSDIALEDLRQAFATWSRYILDKKLSDALENPRQRRAKIRRAEQEIYYAGEKEFPPVKPSIHGFPTRYEVRPKCQGNEDILVYFGVENARVREERKKFIAPIAFAARTKFDPESKGPTGFIWVSAGSDGKGSDLEGSPDLLHWRRPNFLRIILTHEIGHTLGMEHVEGTIMTEQILDYMARTELKLPNATTLDPSAIDQARALIMTDSDAYSHLQLQLPITGHLFDVAGRVRGLEALGEHLAIKGHSATWDVRLKSVNKTKAVLEIKSGHETTTVDVEANLSEPISGPEAFSHENARNLRSSGRILYGGIKNTVGKVLPVILSVNLPDRHKHRAQLIVNQDGQFMEVGVFCLDLTCRIMD